jgi:hypothetical protein
MNSIAAYCIAHLTEAFIVENFKTHLGQEFFLRFGEKVAPSFAGAVVLLVYWLVLLWMYRRKLFLKI